MRALWTLLVLSSCSRAVPLPAWASPERGWPLFLEHCAICHGRTGDGHGVRHEDLSPRPPDFTSAAWRAAATPGRVHDTIRDGRRGTAMPAWRTLTDAQIWDLTAYVLSIAEGKP